MSSIRLRQANLLVITEQTLGSLIALKSHVGQHYPYLKVAGGQSVWEGLVEGQRCMEAAFRYEGFLLGNEDEVLEVIERAHENAPRIILPDPLIAPQP